MICNLNNKSIFKKTKKHLKNTNVLKSFKHERVKGMFYVLICCTIGASYVI